MLSVLLLSLQSSSIRLAADNLYLLEARHMLDAPILPSNNLPSVALRKKYPFHSAHANTGRTLYWEKEVDPPPPPAPSISTCQETRPCSCASSPKEEQLSAAATLYSTLCAFRLNRCCITLPKSLPFHLEQMWQCVPHVDKPRSELSKFFCGVGLLQVWQWS